MMIKILPEWRDKQSFLILSTIIMAVCFSGWLAMLNNFVVEQAQFTGKEIGLLQSFREIPGFLAFTAVFILLVISEQKLALISLCILSIGVALTGFFPFEYGLYATTVLMSIGFHYFETVNTSLTLQWIAKSETPAFMGKILSIKSIASLIAYGAVWFFFSYTALDFSTVYLVFGVFGLLLLMMLWTQFPQFESPVVQHKKIIFRKHYWLFYLLTFFSGARRQIFMVFAGFMMVEKFGYSASDIALLFIANHLLNWFLAPKIGRWIGRVGERKALTFEYVGLIGVFVGYAFVETASMAAILYIIDHVFFALVIAIKTFFQKIADPADIAGSAGLSFTINHIAAVVIPAAFGLLWLISPSSVFIAGAIFAACSLCLAQFIDQEQLKAKVRMAG